MKSILHLGFAWVLLLMTNQLSSQSPVVISQPELELRDNIILISYEILKSSDDDLFRIWISVTDEQGNILNSKALAGDVGNVRGGGSKLITWNYEKDLASLEAGIFVQVFGEPVNSPGGDATPSAREKTSRNEDSDSGREASMAGALLRSVAFPGWGLSYMDRGSMHLIKGVAGYGAIVSAIALNRLALQNYNKYLDSSDQGVFDDYYDRAVSQQNLSRISAYVAAGIWVTDMVWTLLSDPVKNGYQSGMDHKGFRVGTGYEPVSGTPLVAFRYNF